MGGVAWTPFSTIISNTPHAFRQVYTPFWNLILKIYFHFSFLVKTFFVPLFFFPLVTRSGGPFFFSLRSVWVYVCALRFLSGISSSLLPRFPNTWCDIFIRHAMCIARSRFGISFSTVCWPLPDTRIFTCARVNQRRQFDIASATLPRFSRPHKAHTQR